MNVDSDSTWVDEPESSVPTFSWCRKSIVTNGETPRPECDSTATGKERKRESGAAGINEVTGLKPSYQGANAEL